MYSIEVVQVHSSAYKCTTIGWERSRYHSSRCPCTCGKITACLNIELDVLVVGSQYECAYGTITCPNIFFSNCKSYWGTMPLSRSNSFSTVFNQQNLNQSLWKNFQTNSKRNIQLMIKSYFAVVGKLLSEKFNRKSLTSSGFEPTPQNHTPDDLSTRPVQPRIPACYK